MPVWARNAFAKGLGTKRSRPCEKPWRSILATAIAYYQLGTTLFQHGNSDDAAEAALREAIRLNSRFAQAHCNLGAVLARKGDLDGAEESHRMAVWLDPNDAAAYSGLGAFLRDRRQDYDGAIAAFRRASELSLTDGKARDNLGNALLEKGDVDEAIKYFQQAIQLEPDDFTAHLNLCRAQMRKQSWDDAIAAAQEAIRCNPDLAEAHCNLGRALQQKGQLREALEALQRGHELGIQDPNWQYPSARWVQECQELLNQSESNKASQEVTPPTVEPAAEPAANKEAANEFCICDVRNRVPRKMPGEVQGANHSPHRARHPPSRLVCATGAMAFVFLL